MAGNLSSAFNLLLQVHSRAATIERPGASELVSGVVPSTSIDFTSDISEGVAYILGVRLVIPVTTVTYTPLVDTYIDISTAGVLTYTEVANGATAPSIATDNIRVAKVVTDIASITTVVILRTPKSSYGVAAVPIKIAPSNYSRILASVEETTVAGKEFVISKKSLDVVYFPHIRRGDRIKDLELGFSVVTEVREMFGLGGDILGYRVRTN
jgi:hypothetical protein